MREKKPKKYKERLVKPVASLDFDSLVPAIVDGKLVVDKHQTLVLKRARRYEMITLCHVMRTDADGWVVLWDDTLGEQFMFNLNTDVAVHERLRLYDKSLRLRKVVLDQEAQDNVPVDAESDVGPLGDHERDDADELSSVVEDPTT